MQDIPFVDNFGVVERAHYFKASELNVRPTPLVDVDAEYPVQALGREGYLVLQLLINESGAVDDAIVATSEADGIFDESALTAFRQARFSPGMRQGVPVKSEMWIEVWFHAPRDRPAPRAPTIAQTLSPDS